MHVTMSYLTFNLIDSEHHKVQEPQPWKLIWDTWKAEGYENS